MNGGLGGWDSAGLVSATSKFNRTILDQPFNCDLHYRSIYWYFSHLIASLLFGMEPFVVYTYTFVAFCWLYCSLFSIISVFYYWIHSATLNVVHQRRPMCDIHPHGHYNWLMLWTVFEVTVTAWQKADMDVHIAQGSHICMVQHTSGPSHSEQMVTSEHSGVYGN